MNTVNMLLLLNYEAGGLPPPTDEGWIDNLGNPIVASPVGGNAPSPFVFNKGM